jgi:ribosomal protein S18 acetylase RimI-like enzyme
MHQTPGVSVREADSREAIQRYLLRNPDLSFVAEDGAALVGCIMSGHDGRRGYLQHLLVVPAYRERGVASALIEACLAGLEAIGILKSHIDVLATNEAGQRFWTRRGWMLRTDLRRYSFVRSGGDNV